MRLASTDAEHERGKKTIKSNFAKIRRNMFAAITHPLNFVKGAQLVKNGNKEKLKQNAEKRSATRRYNLRRRKKLLVAMKKRAAPMALTRATDQKAAL